MRERVVTFGPGQSLVGILTEPSVPADGRPVALLLNSGVLHRVGACRLHVNLARALADRGFASFRFDFSGIGDSQPRKDSLPFEQSSVLEVQDAMNCLADRRGAGRFLLMGLCSGADAAFFTALAEPRAVGIVQIDGFAYRTPRWYLHHYGPRILDGGVWRRALAHPRRTLDLLLHPGAKLKAQAAAVAPEGDAPEDAGPQYIRVFPDRAWTEAGHRQLVGRGVYQYLIYTHGMQEHLNHDGQFFAAHRGLDFRGTVDVAYWPDCDHLLMTRRHQRLAVESITGWAERHFGQATDAVSLDRVDAAAG
jgi:hypothetical protein